MPIFIDTAKALTNVNEPAFKIPVFPSTCLCDISQLLNFCQSDECSLEFHFKFHFLILSIALPIIMKHWVFPLFFKSKPYFDLN